MVARWCWPTFRPSASCGPARLCSSPPRDAAGFAAAINRLADAPAERQALGQRAATRARDFTLGRQAEQVRQVYASALAAEVLAA